MSSVQNKECTNNFTKKYKNIDGVIHNHSAVFNWHCTIIITVYTIS